jgi:hypothetical protein
MAKRILDQFDLEAEREGNAIKIHSTTITRPFGWGKGILKQRKMHVDGDKKIECRTIKQFYSR